MTTTNHLESLTETERFDYLRQQIELRRQELELREGLPFLHGWPWYTWAWEFFESREKLNFLCAANQVSKSSTQIRKCIHWATETDLWPELWSGKPNLFWYFYPSQKVADGEWLTKWKQFMPAGKYKDDPKYGWKEIKDGGKIQGVQFNSGVLLLFKTYSQKAIDLQTGSVYALWLDEELPFELWNELFMRVNATNGYVHKVFTATLGQEEWRKCLEPRDDEEEFLPHAKKWCVSLYDSQKYRDGTPTMWTDQKIESVRAGCSTHAEFLKRVMGRFVVAGGRKYEAFDATKHMKAGHPIPESWLIYEGVDIGSGGEKAHPGAICFVAVRPDFRAGRVFLAWRGEDETTTAGDIFKKHLELVKAKKLESRITRKFYDWASVDFDTISTRAGEPFEKADKSHDTGEQVINTLFKHNALLIYTDPETAKLAGELSTLLKKTPKAKAKDDLADAFRYAITQVPWDFSFLTGSTVAREDISDQPLTPQERELDERRRFFDGTAEQEAQAQLDAEFAEWNALY